MLKEIYDYFFGEEKSKEYLARLAYLTVVSKYELIEASLPVFVAAGISGSAAIIIEVLSEEDESIESVLTLVYALTMYFIGKWITYLLLRDEDIKSPTAPFPLMRRYKISHLLRHSLSELSGFAWKEFFIIFCLKQIYIEDGLGPTFGSWLLIIAVAFSSIALSSHIQRSYFRLDYVWNQKLLGFETDAFALSIAYILTAIIGLGFWQIGVPVIPSSTILFEWNDGFEDAHNTNGSPLILLYSMLIGAVVATVQVPEEEDEHVADELCDVRATTIVPIARPSELQRAVSGTADTLNPIAVSNHSSFELDGTKPSLVSSQVSTQLTTRPPPTLCETLIDKDALITYTVLWNEFLGYMAGVAYFLLILSFCHITGTYKIIPALIIALLGTYRGPSILAKLRITTEEAQAKAAAAPEVVPTSDEPAPAQGWLCCCYRVDNCCVRFIEGARKNYADLNLKRKGVMLVSVRLTVGWLWEIVLQDGFDMLKSIHALEPYQNALLAVLFVAIILAIVLCVHMYVRDWASDAFIAEDKRTMLVNNSGPKPSIEPIVPSDVSMGHSSTQTV